MDGLCKVNCNECGFSGNCKGCTKDGLSPFGGRCIAAEYIKAGGMSAYCEFKEKLKNEINSVLKAEEIPETEELFELQGEYVNLGYRLPSGETVKFLNDQNIYLGCQIEFADRGVCYGVVADASFILVSSYIVDGSEPEVIVYKRR